MSPTKRETILEIVEEAQKEADSWDAHTMPEVYVRRIRAAMADEVVGYLRRDVDGSQFYERLDRAQLDQECIGGDVYRVVGPPIPLDDEEEIVADAAYACAKVYGKDDERTKAILARLRRA